MITSTHDLGETYAQLRLQLGSYLRKQVRDPVVAQDLLQQLFLKAHESLQIGRPIGNLVGWLYAAARTTVIDYHRSNKVRTVEYDDNVERNESEDNQLQQQLATCLRPFADQLPAIYRDALIATDFQGATMRDTALKQGVSISAVKSRASRARVLLKARLLECCRVELSNGSISDVHRRSTSTCAGGCS
jgi:RNA polymerase sigma-70 factor, ECF subfamily